MNKIDILFEDDYLLVINKPSGIVANISRTSPDSTVQNFLQEELSLPETGETEFLQRSGLVHRLDKDTSGVMVTAKKEEAFKFLKRQFIKRKVYKEYLALAWGEILDPLIKIDAPIKRDPRNRMKMAIVTDGRRALTRGEMIKAFLQEDDEPFTLLKLFPETGRTHQIRVHLAALKHPVAGDPIYMTKKQLKVTSQYYDRLMLHAWKLRINHPKSKKELNFEAPLPNSFAKIYSKPE